METSHLATEVLHGDLSPDLYQRALSAESVAWDIETSGLDWSSDKIGTCQVAFADQVAVMVLDSRRVPKYLAALLEDPSVRKVFHHAPFDLRFMAHKWDLRPANVACTKIASKILHPALDNREHSLMPVLARHLGVRITKDQQVSDWLSPTLTRAQLEYAAADVRYLLPLLEVLERQVAAVGRAAALNESYRYLPTRVSLDLQGVGDVYLY